MRNGNALHNLFLNINLSSPTFPLAPLSFEYVLLTIGILSFGGECAFNDDDALLQQQEYES